MSIHQGIIQHPSENQQPPEKRDYREDGSVEVHSIFATIQGEGPFSGHRATFIRLAGCNLQCPGCDTEYTKGRSRMDPAEIIRVVQAINDAPLVVITGGEPFRQNLFPMVATLLEGGFKVQIETNGTMYQNLPYEHITVVCSPKGSKIHPELEPNLSALKYVIRADNLEPDGLPTRALGLALNSPLARPKPGIFKGAIYIQPEDEKDEAANHNNMQAAVKSALQYGYVLQLQVHKLIGVE